jgi:probable rRNA maturation factor
MMLVECSEELPQPLTAAEMEWLRGCLGRLWEQEGLAGVCEGQLYLTTDEEMRELNRTHRGEDRTTDVLSFPLSEDGTPVDGYLGDVVVSVPQARRQSEGAEHALRVVEESGTGGWGVREEVFFLVVHGYLHLRGWDHAEPDEDLRMRSMEKLLYHRSVAIVPVES